MKPSTLGNPPRQRRLAMACALAFAGFFQPAHADGFDPNSADVRQAYIGEATSGKVSAALTGLNRLLSQAALVPSFGYGDGSIGVVMTGARYTPSAYESFPFDTSSVLQAASDSDLGAPGVPVILDDRGLRVLANFTTPRDFTIGPNAAYIDTNGFDLGITGIITTTAILQKRGAGALILSGANVWGKALFVYEGVVRGNTTSLATDIFNNARVEFNQESHGNYSFAIIGQGQLDKTGSGTLTMSGASNYTGDTNIVGGTLALQGAGSIDYTAKLTVDAGAKFDISAANGSRPVSLLAGNGIVELGANRLDLSSAENSTFGGVIQGSGGLSKSGDGTLTLTGANSYSGWTDIWQGTLALAGHGQVAGPIYAGHGTFDISAADGDRSVTSLHGGGVVKLGGNTLSIGADNSIAGFDGSITGQGGLTKTGTGRMELSGYNDYSGVTRIEQGELVARTFSLSQNVVNNATLKLFRYADDGYPFIDEYSGNISGSGRLVKEDKGYIWLRGTNSYTGGTEVKEGILIGDSRSLQGSITNNAGLAFYQVTDGTYSSSIGGNGSGIVYVYGPGLLTLGSSTSIAGSLANGGRIGRAGTPGTLAVSRDALFAPGSSFVVRADPAGGNDKLVAARAFLQGGSVEVQAASGSYRPQTRYTIVSTTGGVTGQFASVATNLAFLSPRLSYDANNVFLTLTPNLANLDGVVQSGNQATVGGVLAQLQGGSNADLTMVLDAFTRLGADDARRSLDSIGGASRAGLAHVASINQRSINQNVTGRLGLTQSGGGLAPAAGLALSGLRLAFEDSVRYDPRSGYALAIDGRGADGAPGTASKHGFWMRGFGGSGRIDGDEANAGFRYRVGGAMAGYDRALDDALTLGVVGAYSEPQLEQDEAASHAKTKSVQIGLYARYRTGDTYFDGILSTASNPTDMARSVTVGALQRTASASFGGTTLGAQVEVGHTFRGAVDVTPIASLLWSRQHQNGYEEQGAGALNLIVPERTTKSLRSTLGARVLYPFETATMRVEIEGRAGWAHEFGARDALSARFAGDPSGIDFAVSGKSVPRNSTVFGAGVAVAAKRNLRLYADLSGDVNGTQRTYGLSAGLRYSW